MAGTGTYGGAGVANAGAAYGSAAGAGGYHGANTNGACCVAQGEECTACGVGCGGAGAGSMSYVGQGHGAYIQETTYKYVGCGGDFDVVRRRRDFTCVISICLLPLLLLLLWWLLSALFTSTEPYDCTSGVGNWKMMWSTQQKEYCCMTTGIGCTTRPTTAFPNTPPTAPPTPPPTPPPTRPPTGDPFNCAVGAVDQWEHAKSVWCCRNHHKGCPLTPPPYVPPYVPPTAPARPPDPYNCADGFANWQAGWSVGKKAWCCRVHGKGCAGQIGCATTSKPYDCVAGYANWMAGWSVAKKAWCCKNEGKGCPPQAGGCA